MKDFRNQGSYDPRLVVEISGLLLLQVVSWLKSYYSSNTEVQHRCCTVLLCTGELYSHSFWTSSSSDGCSSTLWLRAGFLTSSYYVWSHIYSKCIDQLGKVANPARGQSWTGKINISISAFALENLISRDLHAVRAEEGKLIFPFPSAFAPDKLISRGGLDSPVPSRVSLLISSILRLNLVLTYGIPPEFRGFHLFI